MVTTPATEETAGEAANVDPALTLKSIRADGDERRAAGMAKSDASLMHRSEGGAAGMANDDHSQSSGHGGEGSGMQLDAERVDCAGVCTISAPAAVLIYNAKKGQAARRGDGLAMGLAERFGITSKAVRDIWTMRSWASTTFPHWTPEDHDKFMKKKLCENCRNQGLTSFEHACVRCKARKPRGLAFSAPPPASSTLNSREKKAAGKEESDSCADSESESAGASLGKRRREGPEQGRSSKYKRPSRAGGAAAGGGDKCRVPKSVWHLSQHALDMQIRLRLLGKSLLPRFDENPDLVTWDHLWWEKAAGDVLRRRCDTRRASAIIC